MLGRIVEIADDQRHLSLSRGFMIVERTGEQRAELGRIPLDDIVAVIAHAHGLSYTNNLLVALAERAAPFVLCGANHNVVGMLWSVEGNYQQAKRFDAQLAAKQPLQKRLWADIVKAKLQQQATVLEAVGAPFKPVQQMVRKVRSGDPENMEAQGARCYWGLLFGDSFRRNRDADGINSLLNYAYTVLRAATARGVIAAGLHPTLALHHSNEGNALRLVDDLMEPYRPMMDLAIWHLAQQNRLTVVPDTKRALVNALYHDMLTSVGATPVQVCVQKLAVSLAQVFLGEKSKLDLPLPSATLMLSAYGHSDE